MNLDAVVFARTVGACEDDEAPLSHLSPARGERLEMAARMTRRGLGINVDVIYLGSRPEPALEGLNWGAGDTC